MLVNLINNYTKEGITINALFTINNEFFGELHPLVTEKDGLIEVNENAPYHFRGEINNPKWYIFPKICKCCGQNTYK
jgi:hypothetical protein